MGLSQISSPFIEFLILPLLLFLKCLCEKLWVKKKHSSANGHKLVFFAYYMFFDVLINIKNTKSENSTYSLNLPEDSYLISYM